MTVQLTDADRALLARPLNAILTVAPAPGGRPMPRPVWFEHLADGTVEMISYTGALRVQRLREDPWAAVLVAAPVGETEHWVSLEGKATVHADGAGETMTRLAARYWDLDDPKHKAELDEFLAADTVRIVLQPERIARYRL
ncbi:pyridoxamine 5'-phosphate oxidase family protein [Pseudonocardia sp. CA-107938]|uniref:pyridoxamine 5'-phosphate oxidase family protein n=1 Tax=Pseudonocardia sp. CA-107938 TaxID=3240021 RepID=UPI003D907758